MFELTKYIAQRPYIMLLLAGVSGGLAKFFLPLALLSCALAALFVLRKGSSSGLWFVLLLCIISYLVDAWLGVRPGLNFPIILLLIPPVFLSASILRVTESQGLMVAVNGFFAALMIVFIQIYSGNAVEFWKEWLETAVQGVKGATVVGFQRDGSLQIMNGLMATLLAVASIVSIFLGRWMQAMLINPGGFKIEFQHLLIPPKMLTFFILLCAIFYFVQETVMLDLLLVAGVIYGIQGLAIFHHGANKKKQSALYLLPTYLVLFFIPLFAIVGLACVGISDAFLDYRKLKK